MMFLYKYMYPKNYLFYYFIYNQIGFGEKKWTTLNHNGVIFPPSYEKHNIPIIYNGDKIILEKDAEEFATYYAKYTDTKYIKSRIFKSNFWKDWKKFLGKDHQIKSLDDCDFSLIYKYILDQKEKKKIVSDDEKQKLQEKKEKQNEMYGFVYIDGKKQPVQNYRVEPPGIFLGRGCSPRLGRIKERIYPEDITLNMSKDTPIPPTLSGHKWGNIIHDPTVEWLASWKDNITGKIKYVWLGTQAELRAEKEKKKFDKARKLKKKVAEIRKQYFDDMTQNDDIKLKQMATALYLIDNFALRVGNEKSEEEADTVGVSSLRVEHIELVENNNIQLDFLSKDSVRYSRKQEIHPQVYDNIKLFLMNKKQEEELFDKFKPQDLNNYLKQFMDDLTTKVFRTYNASNLFQKELKKISKKYENYEENDKINILLNEFNKANLRVAIMCNHQKEVSKNFNDQLKKIDEKIKKLKKKRNELKKKKMNDKQQKKEKLEKLDKQISNWKAKKSLKVELKNYSLGTSKINYIDPRITIAFIKKNDIPIEKIFTKTLLGKFEWALDTPSDYKF
jgi:DNA topoisomerase I